MIIVNSKPCLGYQVVHNIHLPGVAPLLSHVGEWFNRIEFD